MPTDITILAEKLRWLGTQRYNVSAIIEVMKYKQRLAKVINEDGIVRSIETKSGWWASGDYYSQHPDPYSPCRLGRVGPWYP